MKRLNDDETVLLISFVQSRECLWNESNADFKRISITKKLWNEIGNQLNISGEDAKCKWKNLRDKFRKLLQREAQEEASQQLVTAMGRWKFYDAMLFLRDSLNRNQQQSAGNSAPSGSANQEVADEEYFQEYSFDFLVKRTPDGESPASATRNVAPGQLQNNKSLRLKRKNADQGGVDDDDEEERDVERSTTSEVRAPGGRSRSNEEDDYYFLMSLLPYIRDLNPTEKLELRSRMQNLVTDSYKKHDLMSKRPRVNQ